MQHLDHGRVLQQLGERRPVVDQQRIDQVGALAFADLQQAGDRVKGVDPHKLGVHRHERQVAPAGAVLRQAGVVTNPVNINSHAALPSRMPRSIYRPAT
ncbi:hypothetical protein D3C71_1617960 [compost metagenome]